MSDFLWDAFLLYAPEDRQIGNDYAVGLSTAGLTIWFDDQTMVESAGVLEKIVDEGLMQSRCGIVLLSKNFTQRCPASRCDALFPHHADRRKTIFPIWRSSG